MRASKKIKALFLVLDIFQRHMKTKRTPSDLHHATTHKSSTFVGILSTMNAVRYHGPNVPLTLEEVPVPTDLGSDEVLVQIKAAALCHTELHFCDGTLNLGVNPMTLGHEATGIITKVGSNVSQSRVGERVICYYYVGCGDCRWCRQGEEQICPALKAEYGFISNGGLAQYIKTPSRNAVVLPDSLDFVDAAPIGCGVTTAVQLQNCPTSSRMIGLSSMASTESALDLCSC